MNGDGDVDGDGDDDGDNSTNHLSYCDGNDNHKRVLIVMIMMLMMMIITIIIIIITIIIIIIIYHDYHEFVSCLVFEPLLCLLQFCVCFEYLYIYELDSGSYFATADHPPPSSSQALTTKP